MMRQRNGGGPSGPPQQNKTMTPNTQQELAAISTASNIIVVAGPGSGKTSTLVARVAHLIDRRVNPKEIIVITYTNAAAAEINRRVADKWPHAGVGYCGTLHGFLLRLIRQHGVKLGMPAELAVISDTQRGEILDDVAVEVGWKGSRKAALEAIATNPLLNRKATMLPKAGLLAAAYHRRMLENGLLDFDAILQYGRAVLDFCPPVGKHLLVDEFQDASDADDEIYSALPVANRFMVGDPDQSIFGWRGGNPANFRRRAAKPDASVFYLETNYRCGVAVCEAANRLIRNNPDRLPKQTVPVEIHDNSMVVVVSFKDEAKMLAALTQDIASHPEEADGAVLVRTNAQAKVIADHLEGCGIKVARRSERAEPLDWQAIRQYIALLCAPDNDVLAYAWLKRCGGEDMAKAARRRALDTLTTINRAEAPEGRWQTPSLADLPDALAEQSGGWREGIDLVKAAIAELPKDSTIADLALALAQKDGQHEEVGRGIVVATMHAAKGREWHSVWLPGWVEGAFPNPRAPLDEERRLAFVAVTRAKQRCVLLVPQSVRDPWTDQVSDAEPSQFIAELKGDACNLPPVAP